MGRQFNCRQNRLSSQRFGAPTIDLNTGGAIGEEFGLRLWDDVSAFQIAHGQPVGHRRHRAHDRARGVLVLSLSKHRMLKYKVEYETISIEEYEAKYKEQQIKYMKKKAAKLGFQTQHTLSKDLSKDLKI
jgi:hypothetical protein